MEQSKRYTAAELIKKLQDVPQEFLIATSPEDVDKVILEAFAPDAPMIINIPLMKD